MGMEDVMAARDRYLAAKSAAEGAKAEWELADAKRDDALSDLKIEIADFVGLDIQREG